jgi:hypothetical protein
VQNEGAKRKRSDCGRAALISFGLPASGLPKCKRLLMELLPNYWKRLHKASREDFKAYWSAHRLWATFANAIAPFVTVLILASLRWGGNMISVPWIVTLAAMSFVISLIGNYLIAMRHAAKSLDAGLQDKITEERRESETKIATLKDTHSDELRTRDQTIKEQAQSIELLKETVRKLVEKPPRTKEQERYFLKAQETMTAIGEKGVEVLRLLKQRGKLSDSPFHPVATPLGMNRDETLGVLVSLHVSHVVNETSTIGPLPERSWEIVPSLLGAFGELLF